MDEHAGGRAYVNGVRELGRTLGGFGREIGVEAGRHTRTTFEARNLHEAAELQAGWAQRRIETSTTHGPCRPRGAHQARDPAAARFQSRFVTFQGFAARKSFPPVLTPSVVMPAKACIQIGHPCRGPGFPLSRK